VDAAKSSVCTQVINSSFKVCIGAPADLSSDVDTTESDFDTWKLFHSEFLIWTPVRAALAASSVLGGRDDRNVA
jgi:hypothetical protein